MKKNDICIGVLNAVLKPMLVLFCLLASYLPAAQDDTLIVTARGVGIDDSGARKDALINAMQQAVGSFLDSETIIENDKIIRDRLLSVSEGFVKNYDVLDGPTKRDDGLFEIQIKAEVQRNRVQERLSEIRVSVGSVAGKDAAAEAITKIQNAQQGQQLLLKHLDGFLEKHLVARLIDQDGKASQQIRPQIENQEDPNRVLCQWNIEVYFDMKAYYEQTVPQLDKVFQAISEVQPRTSVRFGNRSEEKWPLTGYPLLKISRWPSAEIYYLSNSNHIQPVLMLSVGRDKFGENERFRHYTLPKNLYDKTLGEIALRASDVNLHFFMLDDNGGILREEIFKIRASGNQDLGRLEPEFLQWSSRYGAREFFSNIISPRFRAWFFHGPQDRLSDCDPYTDTKLLVIDTLLDTDDLAKISDVRFQFKR